MPPGHPPKRPKVDPSRSQEAMFSILNFDLILGSIFIPFWLPKCLPLGTTFAPKIVPKNYKKSKFPKSHLKTTQFRPKIAPRGSKRLQEAPKRLPRDSQEAQKAPQEAPQSLEECLRSQKGTASGLNKTKQHPDANLINIHRALRLICHGAC